VRRSILGRQRIAATVCPHRVTTDKTKIRTMADTPHALFVVFVVDLYDSPVILVAAERSGETASLIDSRKMERRNVCMYRVCSTLHAGESCVSDFVVEEHGYVLCLTVCARSEITNAVNSDCGNRFGSRLNNAIALRNDVLLKPSKQPSPTYSASKPVMYLPLTLPHMQMRSVICNLTMSWQAKHNKSFIELILSTIKNVRGLDREKHEIVWIGSFKILCDRFVALKDPSTAHVSNQGVNVVSRLCSFATLDFVNRSVIDHGGFLDLANFPKRFPGT
jgi:hypothetical protein